MPDSLQFKPLPANHGNQILELWVISRSAPNPGLVEIAEHPDGSMKAYGTKEQALSAIAQCAGEGWIVETIWLLHKGWSDLPPSRSRQIRSELAQ